MQLFKMIAVTILFSICNTSFAACNWTLPYPYAEIISTGKVIVKSSDPIGTILYTRLITSGQNNRTIFQCTNSGDRGELRLRWYAPVAGMPNVHATNISGVGVKVSDKNGRYFGHPGPFITDSTIIDDISPIKIELIKTGPVVKGGVIQSGTLYSLEITGNSITNVYGAINGGTIDTDNTCEVKSSVIPVNMGSVYSSEFKRIGTTAGTKDVVIPLICAESTRVNITFDGISDVSNPDIISLNPAENSATGIGIQLLNKNTGNPLPLKSPISMGTIQVGGPVNFEFSARYYQISEKVSGGRVRANANFTLTYN